MDLRSGTPYFLIKNGYLFSYPSLDRNSRTDVVIIGGGICGALVAYYLVESGVDVVVLDRRHPGMGSTCASTALLEYEIDVSLVELSKKMGASDAAACYLLCLDAIYMLKHLAKKLGIDSEFESK